ncbi:LysR family transcriptional regulator [Sphingomonas flavalba]|uniref:LysR family transcriptional regulator n=1 Tax=Sphingomonas flavalba TaxID=2559804 RepID=UPI00109E091A|nr:LysR family transcriptional regulator [Sphingomonas flavalba]
MIDRYLLRYFLAVIDHGNFSKAAAQCNVSQPTLSVGIAKLERLLDRSLFQRSNRRVELTEAGARFAVHARRIEGEFSLAERAVGAVPARSTFRLGVLTTMPSAWIAAIVRQCAAHDDVQRVEWVEGRERELQERLRRGRLDAALTIVRADDSRFAGEVLLTEGYALAMPASHPLAGEAEVAAAALADNVMIVRRQCEALPETSRHFTSHGVRPFFAARTTNDDRALALVQAGLGVTVMPEGFTAPGVVRPRLAGFDLVRAIGILHAGHVDAAARAAAPALNTLRAVVPTLAG